jgi:hypothetical protein
MSQPENPDEILLQSSDPTQSMEYLTEYLGKKQSELAALPADADPVTRARLSLDVAEALVGVNRNDEAWELARQAFDIFMTNEVWQEAVEACDVLYQSSQPASLVALAHGVWLAVTYPVDPSLTVTMLGYIVDETPPKADGAAIAAVAAHYIADIRSSGKKRESLTFLTRELLANVAKAHSNVADQDAMHAWMERLRLYEPEVFLPRLSLVLGAIVPQEQWWFDRDALRAKIPD